MNILQEIDDLFFEFYMNRLPALKNRFEYWYEDEKANFWKDPKYISRVFNGESRIVPNYQLGERFNEVDLAEAW